MIHVFGKRGYVSGALPLCSRLRQKVEFHRTDETRGKIIHVFGKRGYASGALPLGSRLRQKVEFHCTEETRGR